MVEDNFEYSRLFDYLTTQDLEKGKKKIEKAVRKLKANWNISSNSQWVLRNYLATKMLMSATVMLNSSEFGKKHNIKVTEPYLMYYSVLNCARAVMFTNPNVDWNNGELTIATHSKTINIVGDAIAQFSKKAGETIKDILESAREYRELFSYKFPAKGITDFAIDSGKAIEVCSFLAEFAQYQSEILETINFGNKNMEVNIDETILEKGFIYKGEKYEYLDNDDWYRLDYMRRKQPFPVSLYLTLSEGMVEDFFGAWYSDKAVKNKNIFDPDKDCRLIFPFP